jgi:hypothetical protein
MSHPSARTPSPATIRRKRARNDCPFETRATLASWLGRDLLVEGHDFRAVN